MMRTEPHETRARTRVISGSVNSDGTRKMGEGFTVSRTALGVYVIRWSPLLVKHVISCLVTMHTGIGFPTVTTDWTSQSIQVVIWNPGVTAAIDSDFGFVATVISQ